MHEWSGPCSNNRLDQKSLSLIHKRKSKSALFFFSSSSNIEYLHVSDNYLQVTTKNYQVDFSQPRRQRKKFLTKYSLYQPLEAPQYVFILVEAVMAEPIPRDKVSTD
jgi:hypothetical protein